MEIVVFIVVCLLAFIFYLSIKNKKERNEAVNALRAMNEWGGALNAFWRSSLLSLAFDGSVRGHYDERLNSREMFVLLENLLHSYGKLVKYDPQNPYVKDEKILEVILAPITNLFICPCWCHAYNEKEALFHCQRINNKFGKCCVKCDKCGKPVNALTYDLHKFLCEKLRLIQIQKRISAVYA